MTPREKKEFIKQLKRERTVSQKIALPLSIIALLLALLQIWLLWTRL